MAELRADRKTTVSQTSKIVSITARAKDDGTGRIVLDQKDGSGTRVVYDVISEAERAKLVSDLQALAPAPVPDPTPDPIPTPAPDGSVIKLLDYSTGDLSQWDSVQDPYHSPYTEANVGKSKCDVVLSPTSGTKYALSAEVWANSNDATRAEVLTTSYMIPRYTEWLGSRLFVPSTPNKASGWAAGGYGSHNTVMQFKNDGTGSPPVEFGIWDGGAGDQARQGLCVRVDSTYYPLVGWADLYDVPIDLAVRTVFSSDPSVGQFELWVNGVQRVRLGADVGKPVATLLSGLNCYLKQGLYTTGKSNNKVFWTATTRGTTRAVVDPFLRFLV